jgi:hypothetical protein
MRKWLRDWLGLGGENMAETTVVPVSAPVEPFTDANKPQLQELERQHQEATGRLAQRRPVYAALKLKEATDAQAGEDARELGLLIIADEKLVATLQPQIAAKQRAIEDNRANALRAATLVADTEARFGPAREHIRQLSDAVLAEAWTRSRELDHLYHLLLQGTSDRRFRRPGADPFRDIKEQVEDLQHRLDRIRAVRSQVQIGKLAAAIKEHTA